VENEVKPGNDISRRSLHVCDASLPTWDYSNRKIHL